MKKTDSIPTARAFGVPARMTLDEQCAMERFLGKSRQEAYDMLKTDFCFYEEDLACMGAEAFRFYVLAVQDLADDCMRGDNMDAYSLLEQIVSMLDMRHTLYQADEKEPLDSISVILETCRRFCNQSFPNPLHAPSPAETASLLRRLDRLKSSYANALN